MTDGIEFAKLSGSGNDFICIDNLDGRYDAVLQAPSRVGRLARTLCRRGLGVGADGVIFATRPEAEGVADLSARFFESDGSEAELCGNGTACFVRWVIDRGMCPDREIRILTPAGVVLGRTMPDRYVRVCIPLPEQMVQDIDLKVDGQHWECDFVVTGVPHAILYVRDVERLDVARWGPVIRFHQHFGPRGVNANFVQVLGTGELAIRTWEFGVEGETLACGTGSAAAAIMAAKRFAWPADYTTGEKPVLLRVRSGDTLRVYLTIEKDGSVSDLCLETLVRSVFAAVATPQLSAEALAE